MGGLHESKTPRQAPRGDHPPQRIVSYGIQTPEHIPLRLLLSIQARHLKRKIHNAFLKQLCVAGADAVVPGLQLYPLVWTPTYFSPCDLLLSRRRMILLCGGFFPLREKREETSFICVLVLLLLCRQCCSQIQSAPWELLLLCRTALWCNCGFCHRTGRLFKVW